MSRHHNSINSHRWSRVRRQIFQRDGHRCTSCGRPGRLECDHVTPLEREPGQDPYNVNGLQTLCRRCHIEKTRQENRRPLTDAERDWKMLVDELAD